MNFVVANAFRKMLLPSKTKTNSSSACRVEMLLRSNNKTGSARSETQNIISSQRLPFGELERNSIHQQLNRNSYTDMPLKFKRTNNHEMIPSGLSAIPSKENINYLG